MAQAKSGFSTEGTQYGTDGSFYLLDTVPGSGSVIEGPVTVTNNLTVTGSETIQGALGVAGNITAPGVFQVAGAAAPLSLVGSATNSGGISMSLPAGASGGIVVTSSNNQVLEMPPNGSVLLQAQPASARPNTLILKNSIDTAALGYGCTINQKLRLNAGLALAPSDGTNQVPAVAVLSGPSYFFQMTSNKAFITSPGAMGANPIMIVRFPPGLIPAANNLVPLIGPPRSGVQTNILTTGIDGDGFQVTILCANPLLPLTFSIVVL